MAASIIAGVCEDRQDYDYELIRPSKAEKTPKLCIPAGIRSKNPPSSPANVAPPSHNVRPVTSVPSLGAWGPGPLLPFASTEAPAASSAWTTSRWPCSAATASGPWPRSGELGCRWRRDVPSHRSCFGGFRRISGLKNWEFGPPFLIDTCICTSMYRTRR